MSTLAEAVTRWTFDRVYREGWPVLDYGLKELPMPAKHESFEPHAHAGSPKTVPVDEGVSSEPRGKYGTAADRAARLDGTSLHAIEVEQSRRGDEFLKECSDEELAAAVARRKTLGSP